MNSRDVQARRDRAAQILSKTQNLLSDGDIKPAQLLDAPARKWGDDRRHEAQFVASYSQEAAMAASGGNAAGANGIVGVMIFGSARKPGGGWKNGAKAQEEDISLSSTWGLQAEKAPTGFYGTTNGLGTDQVLMARGLWLRDANGVPCRVAVDFAGVAAPNLNAPEVKDLPMPQLIDHLARRLTAALDAWKARGVDTLVLGAIGCGVFGWKGEDSAKALRMALNTTTWKGHLILAMPDPELERAFRNVLGDNPAERYRRGP